MNTPGPCDDVVERLAAVLAGILATGSAEPSAPPGPSSPTAGRLALRGATAILPAVLAMRQLQEWMRGHRGSASWDGLLHRRCRMTPAHLSTEAAVSSADPSGLVIQQIDRAGWELLRATTRVDVGTGDWHVTHEVARRAEAHPRVSGGWEITDGGAGINPSSGARSCWLTYGDIASWAEVTGDRNPIHLLPGKAAEAGLRAGTNDVVAHGLLVGALSLALVQSSTHRHIGLEFIGSADVPTSPRGDGEPGATLVVDLDTGAIVQAGRPVLRRR